MGPVRHDYRLPQLDARIIFDLHLDQYLQTDILLRGLDVEWNNQEFGELEYTYSLSLMVSLH